MSPWKIPLSFVAISSVAFTAFAQQINTEFKITKVESTLIDSPMFSGVSYNKKTKAKPWLEVETTFEWTPPRQAQPSYTDELTFTYYILLGNKSRQYPQGTLLVGSVTHTSIPPEKDLHSVVYVSPRALERFFDGKVPPSAQAVEAVGVTVTKQGQPVAEYSGKFQSQWWNKLNIPQTTGFVLNKNETPFAPLAWDYYEAIKPKSSGL